MISRPFEDIIHELCTEILSEPDPQALPQRIINHVQRTFPVEWSTLWLTEQKGLTGEKQLRLSAATGLAVRLMTSGPDGGPAGYDFGEGLTGYIAAEQTTVNITCWEDFDKFRHEQKYDGVMYGTSGARDQCTSVLGLPLRLKSSADGENAEPVWRVIGVLKLENVHKCIRPGGHFTDEDVRIVVAYAAVVAVALEKAQMRADSLRTGKGLLTISARLLASLGEPPNLADIVKETAEVISAQACALWLRSGMELRLAAAFGYPGHDREVPPYSLEVRVAEGLPAAGLTVFVAHQKKPLNLRTMADVKGHFAWRGANDQSMWKVEEAGKACYSFLAIPLVDEETGQVRGVFKIENKRPTMFQLESYFNTEDQHLLEALGNSINSSLAIAERFDRLKRLEKLAGQIQYPDGQEAALFLLLTALTHGDGLGYNRAMAFLVDKEDAPSRLTCRFAVGQLAMEAWHGAVVSTNAKLDLHRLLEDFEEDKSRFLDTAIMRAWSRREVSLTDIEHQKIAHHAVAESSTTKYITDSLHENDLFKNFALGDFALTPIRVGNRLRGIIYCDNRFTGNTINRFELQILDVFAGMAGAILDAAAVPNKLREANEEAWRLFSQPAAHRLGTETNIIDGEVYYHGLPALQRLEELVGPGHPASGEMREALAVIRRSASRLRDAAKDYRQLTLDPEGPHRFDIRELIREAIERGKLDGLQASLVAPEFPVIIVARKRRLGYVFDELLLNAWKESPAARRGSGPPIRVRLAVTVDPTAVQVEVADSGPGIAPKLQSKLFLEPQTGRHGGTGLGMLIIKRNLQLEGGDIRIWAEGRTDEYPGACFRISLPTNGQGAREVH